MKKTSPRKPRKPRKPANPHAFDNHIRNMEILKTQHDQAISTYSPGLLLAAYYDIRNRLSFSDYMEKKWTEARRAALARALVKLDPLTR